MSNNLNGGINPGNHQPGSNPQQPGGTGSGTTPGWTAPVYTGNDIGNVQMYGQYQDTATGINDAWTRAVANWQADKGKYYQGAGYNEQTGGWNYDPLSGHAQMDQMYGATLDSANAAALTRGFQLGGGGLALRQRLAGKQAAEAGMLKWKQEFEGGADALTRQGVGINEDRNNALQDNKNAFYDYLIKNGLFDVNKPHLEQDAVDMRLKTIARAWKKKFGGLDHDNAHGMSFQEWIDKMGNKLYDPNAHYGAAGRSF